MNEDFFEIEVLQDSTELDAGAAVCTCGGVIIISDPGCSCNSNSCD